MKEVRPVPRLERLDYDFTKDTLDRFDAYLTLSRKDVLGIVQSSLDELGPVDRALIEIKQQVLEDVADGNLATALRTAIVGAGKRGCRCCD